MSRIISQLTAGTEVWVDETISNTVVHTPYIYLGLDESGNARLLRGAAAIQKHMNATNVASYDGCEADVWLENATDGFLSRLDAATQAALQNTTIKYVDYNQSGAGTAQVLSIARRCFLLSYSEEGYGNDAAGNEGQSYLEALKTYTGKTVADQARITYNETGVTANTWMRTASTATNFRFVQTGGNSSGIVASNGFIFLRPALSVAPTTPVSDEGAEFIFLLPDGRITTWDIEATMSLGETPRQPLKGKLLLPHDNFTVLTTFICNNYADANPTWIPCDDNDVISFGTIKTADHWELGCKVIAKSASPNQTIGEPAIIVKFANE